MNDPPAKWEQKPTDASLHVCGVREDNRGRAAFIVSIIAVLISAGAAALAWWQGHVANKNTSIQLRAYVFAKPLPEVWALKGTPEVYVYFRNGGQTPASDLKLRGAIRIMRDSPTNRDFETAPFRETDDVLDPSSEINSQNLFRLNRSLKDEEIASIADGRQARFYVWGDISYRDVFRQPHRTSFCFYYFGAYERAGGLRAGNLHYCPKPASY